MVCHQYLACERADKEVVQKTNQRKQRLKDWMERGRLWFMIIIQS